MQDVKGVMSQYGEVLEVRKGKLSRRLPHVTNGTWTVRMIVGEGKIIPSFVFVNDDGEIWQLAHDNQETTCWQCGGQGHIGSRCKEQAVSIENDLLPVDPAGQVGGAPAVPVQTWAHVVRGMNVRQPGVQNVVNNEEEANAAQRAKDEADAVKRDEAAAAAKRVEDESVAAAKRGEEEAAAVARREAVAAKRVEDDLEVERLVAAKRKEDESAAERLAAATKRDERDAASKGEEREATRREGAVSARAGFEASMREGDEAAKRDEDEVRAEVTTATGSVEKVAVEAASEIAVIESDEKAATLFPGAAMEDNVEVVEGAERPTEFGFEVDPGSLTPVTIMSPNDSILHPAKFSRLTDSAVPSSCEGLLGSSPELPHKDARGSSQVLVPLTEDVLKLRLEGEDHSLYGSSISPILSSEQEESEQFSDAGSSNAIRPASADMDLE